jgi:hypothetical protein
MSERLYQVKPPVERQIEYWHRVLSDSETAVDVAMKALAKLYETYPAEYQDNRMDGM